MRPVLSDTLPVLLPTEQDTLMIRACLCAGDAGKEAWYAWLEHIGDLREELVHCRTSLSHFLPLLHVAMNRCKIEVQGDLAFHLRAAYFHEELRGRSYQGVLQNVLRALKDAEIDLTVLKGAALAGTVYDNWALRHCHDIDLLVDQVDLTPASRALQNAGVRQYYEPSRTSRDIRLLHDSGLPIELHADLFRPPLCRSGKLTILERRQTKDVVGLSTHVLSPSDTLLHVCGHALCPESRASLRWVTDAWSIAVKCADLDWDAFLEAAARTNLALPLDVMLTYLATHLDAPIPDLVLCSLTREATHLGVHGRYHGLRNATRDWRSRAFLLRWRLFPSPSYLRWKYGVGSRGSVCLLYFARVVRYVARHARLVLARSGSIWYMKRPSIGGSCDE
ncbi:MAG: nucleotidyltransferase family protein [Candidatus Bipolaricaulota bacterium]